MLTQGIIEFYTYPVLLVFHSTLLIGLHCSGLPSLLNLATKKKVDNKLTTWKNVFTCFYNFIIISHRQENFSFKQLEQSNEKRHVHFPINFSTTFIKFLININESKLNVN